METYTYRDIGPRWPLIAILSVLLVAAFLCPGCGSTVGTTADYDAAKIKLANPSPSGIFQISPGENGGSTAVNTVGPVMQTFVDAKLGDIKTIGGGVANKVIALPVGGGRFLLVSSQADAVFEASEIRDSASGAIVAKNVKVSTNVTDPTRAHADALKVWGPVYVKALEQARLGNKDMYEAVTKSIEAAGPLVLEAVKAAYGVP
ncbi:MAG TPA: hypothetical protein VEB22_05585 [Phycisphaerales bacterium]|nr:hypothetical protein [Phycisphaerales bacterium]